MRKFSLLPLPIAMAACSPAAPAAGDGDVAAAAPDYATQLTAPSPDYAALRVDRADFPPSGEIEREATAEPPADAKALGDLWVQRLSERGALMGYGLAGKTEHGAVQSIDTLLTARQFDALVAENGWTVPPHIAWRFKAEMAFRAVTPEAAPKIRIWPSPEQRTGIQLMAAFYGRIFIRDGCFFVENMSGEEQLAWILAETGLDVDAEGYLVLRSRYTGEVTGRLGEEFIWAGPNSIDQDDPRLVPLHDACGEGEVLVVGNPEAAEYVYLRYPHTRPGAEVNPPPPPPPPPLAEG